MVFSRWGAMVSILCLLLCVAAGSWLYRAEEGAARDKARLQLAAIARVEADRLLAQHRRIVADGMGLCNDPLLTTTVAGFLQDGREADLLSSRLQVVLDQGGYDALLLVDTTGEIRLRLGASERFSRPAAEAISKVLRISEPILVIDRIGEHASHPRFEVVVPIVRADLRTNQSLGAVVLVIGVDRLYQKVENPMHGDEGVDQRVLVFRKQDMALPLGTGVAAAHLRIMQPSRQPPGTLVARVVAGETGLVRGRDPRGVEALGYILPLPEDAGTLVVSEPVSRIFGLWRYRAAVLLFIFAGAAGIALFFWQYGRKLHYKALYDSESRLRRSLEHQKILLQAIGDGVIATGPSGLIEMINPAAEQLTGWRREEAVGRSLEEVLTLIDGPGQPLDVSCFATGSDADRTVNGLKPYRLLNRRNEVLDIAAVSAPLRNDRGDLVGTVVAFHDRSVEYLARQRVEVRLLLREYAYTHGVHELLHRGLQELAGLLESPKGFCCCLEAPHWAVAVERLVQAGGEDRWSLYDAEGEAACSGIEQWLADSPAGVQVVETGHLAGLVQQMDEAQFPGCRFGTVREILLPVQRAGRRVALLAVTDKARPYSSREADLMAQMGEYIWRLVEQKQMEEALLASERRYRSLYRSMMDAFVVTDLKGRIRECNEPYAAMLGFASEELKGRFARDFTPEPWQRYEQEYVRRQLMHGGCSELYEKEYRRRDGTVFPVELRTYLLVNNEGQPEGMSAVVRDISARKLVQQEQERLRERLIQAERLESVGQLAGGVAHDFNNMLSVIIGYAELALRQMEIPDPLDKYLQEIVRAGKRSADVTRQLLAFARKQTISPKMLDLNATLDSMLKMLRRLIGEDVELVWLPGKEIWPIRMDPSQIDQLLANLCINARDAISGVGKITIETGRVSFDEAYCSERNGFLPGDFVVLAVSDNGSGIDRDILDKIFEPFFTTKAVGLGTGLGLATVYGIVKQNNGFINVYSEHGQGTTFRIYLPRQEGKVEVGNLGGSETVPMGKGEIILVVEDEESMLALNQTMLEQLNYTVLTAATPGTALQLAREYGQKIDLVLTDVIMPEMNGRELSRAIGAFCPTAKILFMSGYTANVIAHRGELDEGMHFITKPFSTSELAVKIRETLLAYESPSLPPL